MRSTFASTFASTLPVLAAAALSVAAVRPAAAQHAPAPAHRAVAVYRLVAPREASLPVRVTVADSAGALVASFRLAGERVERPMTVTVLDTDLVLQGETPAGVVTLRLVAQNDPGSAPLTGHWSHAGRQGALRGTGRGYAAR